MIMTSFGTKNAKNSTALSPWAIAKLLPSLPPVFIFWLSFCFSSISRTVSDYSSSSLCPSGQFYRHNACGPCPAGLDCVSGNVCPPWQISMRASGRCCNRTIHCPKGKVVDATLCQCVDMACSLDHLLIFTQGVLRCASAKARSSSKEVVLSPEIACVKCQHPWQALDPESCACLAIQPCTRSQKGSSSSISSSRNNTRSSKSNNTRIMKKTFSAFPTQIEHGTLWKTGAGMFECVY